MSFLEFLLEYYVWIITVLVILIIGIIGFIVDSIQNNKEKDTDNNTNNNNLSENVKSDASVKKRTLFKRKVKNSSDVDLKSLENNEPLVLEENLNNITEKNDDSLINNVNATNVNNNLNVDSVNTINNNFSSPGINNEDNLNNELNSNINDISSFSSDVLVSNVVNENGVINNNEISSINSNDNLEQKAVLNNNQNEIDDVVNSFDMNTFNNPLSINPTVNNENISGVIENKINNTNTIIAPPEPIITTNTEMVSQVNNDKTVSPYNNVISSNSEIQFGPVIPNSEVNQNASSLSIPNPDMNVATQNNQPLTSIIPQTIETAPLLKINDQIQIIQPQNQMGVVNQNVNIGVNNAIQNNNVGLNNQVSNNQVLEPINNNVNINSQAINTNVGNNNPSANSQSNVMNPSVVTTTIGAQPFDISSMFANNN